MQFVLYTEKTVSQALSALNERMHAKETSTRPAIDGWVEKNGAFSLGVTTRVAGRFTRTTYMRGKLERQSGITVVKGTVSSGATRESKAFIFIACALVAAGLILSGNVLMGLIVVPFALALYIPLTGDHTNSEILMNELQRALKAKVTPPKPAKKHSESKASAAKPVRPAAAAPVRAAPKPAPKPAPSLGQTAGAED